MEILDNIWELLIMPNEICRKILMIPCTFIETYIFMTLFLTIFNISVEKKNKILYIAIAPLIPIFSQFLIPQPFNVFINYISNYLFIVTILKISPFKSLICLACSVGIFSIISILILNPYITLFNITSTQLSSIPIYNIGFLLTIYIIDFILIFILKSRKIELHFLEDIDKKNKYIIFANFIFGILTIVVQACIIFYYVDKLPIIITILSCISLLIYYGISIYSLAKVMKLTLTTKKLESAEEYNRSLHILHDSVRGFKHDFDNIVTTIGGYIRTEDMKGLKNYYLQLEDDCQKVNNLYLLNPEIINNPRCLQLTY